MARRPGVDQRGLPLRGVDQDRVALADVEELERRGLRRPGSRLLRRGWTDRESQDDCEGEPGEPSHRRMSPPGSDFFRSAWTLRVSSATFLVASVSRSIWNVRTSLA